MWADVCVDCHGCLDVFRDMAKGTTGAALVMREVEDNSSGNA